MTDKTQDREKMLTTQYQQFFTFNNSGFAENLSQPDLRGHIVSVTTYSAFEKPIEGWSGNNAKLGSST